jgi:hypothetical protein
MTGGSWDLAANAGGVASGPLSPETDIRACNRAQSSNGKSPATSGQAASERKADKEKHHHSLSLKPDEAS